MNGITASARIYIFCSESIIYIFSSSINLETSLSCEKKLIFSCFPIRGDKGSGTRKKKGKCRKTR